MLAADLSPEGQAIDAFWADEAAVEAAYRDGTLKAKLIELETKVFDVCYKAWDALAVEYFKPEALDVFASLSKLFALEAEAQKKLTEEQLEKIDEKLDALAFPLDSDAFNALLQEGKWAEAKKVMDDYVSEAQKIYADYGIVIKSEPKKTVWQKIWDFILKYILFGWLIDLFKK